MTKISLKPTNKSVVEFYKSLHNFNQLGFIHEGAVSPPFAVLLESTAKQFKWNLVQQYPKKFRGKSLRIDGAIVDQWGLPHGYWEAKDEKDDLRKEVKKKFAVGYPKDNIIFQEPAKAILWQNEKEIGEFNLLNAEELIRLLELFFDYTPPAFEEWEQAESRFREQLPELGEALLKVLDDAKLNNKVFREAFASFYELCRTSINPNLSEKAVEEMLIQHLLTERIFRTVFKNSEFTQRNVIAREIETVIMALTSQSFSREEFLGRFDHFYKALEHRAAAVETFAEKQTFLNKVYERFFQGFAVDVADTHGIVYTPQPIVNFMVKSVEDILRKEFGKSLSDENVHILDPFVGTGNFIVRIMDEIKRTSLEHKYANELHCNEVMLLPYYIASMNIEHEYFEKIGRYEPFEGICLVDTFDMTEGAQSSLSFMTEENTARIERQKKSPITVVIGNPPYNVGQLNENDNNKNRKYPAIDTRIAETYATDSSASNKNKISDPYIKAIRWATDRINDEGIVALVTNNGFLEGLAFDGMRKHLESDFDKIYHIDLKGNARNSGERRRREGGNIFDDLIRVGIGITFLVKKANANSKAEIHLYQIEDYLKSSAKKLFLDKAERLQNIPTIEVQSDEKYSWITDGMNSEFKSFLSIGNKEGKADKDAALAIFNNYGLGLNTNRDNWAFNFDSELLWQNIGRFIDTYNSEVPRLIGVRVRDKELNIDDFVLKDDTRIKWSSRLKECLSRYETVESDRTKLRPALYRPFIAQYVYFDRVLNQRVTQFPHIFPTLQTENKLICVRTVGNRLPFHCLITDRIADLHFTGDSQCFPYYVYNEDGTNRRENITDWALEQFREHYGSVPPAVAGGAFASTPEKSPPATAGGTDRKTADITKWDIFYYTYAILYHPEYREKYAANLKRELPRIPFAPDFWSFAKAGKELADIHVNYEDQPEYKLDMIENGRLPLDWKVEKMRYNKEKTAIVYNDFLTIAGIPPDVHEYRLGNRSALDWIVDQYKVSIDKRSGITNDPNRDDEPQYIVRLIKKIVTVSLRTNEIVNSLPNLSDATV